MLLPNSRFCESRVKSNLIFLNFNRNSYVKRNNQAFADEGGVSPGFIKLKDVDRIQIGKTPNFFARKFDHLFNMGVVNYLDQQIYGKYPESKIL